MRRTILLGLCILLYFLPVPPFGTVDFVQYWTSGKLLLDGQNPYDPRLVETLQRAANPYFDPATGVILNWNTPLLGIFCLLAAAAPVETGFRIWFVLSCACIGAAVWLLAKAWKKDFSPLLLAVALCSPALGNNFYFGQISSLLLLSLCAAIYWRSCSRPFLAGVALSVTLVKPHLLLLYYLSESRRGGFQRRWCAGLASGAILLGLIPLFFVPDIYHYYDAAMSAQPPLYWKNPALGSLFQEASGVQAMWMRFVPVLLALPFAFFVEALTLIPLSLLCAPYGWVYDQLLLVPVLLRMDSRRGIFFVAALHAALWLPHFGSAQDDAWWYPLGVLIAMRAARDASRFPGKPSSA